MALGLGLHGHGILLDLYWTVWWWDVLTHVFSGALLAAGCYATAIAAMRSVDRSLDIWLHVVIFGVMLGAGIGWEIYEIYAPWLTVYGQIDTAKDIVVGLCAWVVVAATQHRLIGSIPRGMGQRIGQWVPGGPTENPAGKRPVTDGGTSRE